jgi:branched-chain amino acid transport system permease protein
MNLGTQLFLATTLVYLFADVIACMGLNLQFGVTGVLNFAYILFVAIGAYTVGVLTLGPDAGNGGFQHYLFGASLPFPLAFVIAMAAGALAAIPIGWIAVGRLRADLQAVVLLVVSIIASTVAQNDQHLVNGSAGLSLIPKPFESSLNLSTAAYNWFYVCFAAAVMCVFAWVIRRLSRTPMWRVLRSVRDGDKAAQALGRDAFRYRMLVMIIGGAFAAGSGALLSPYISIWSPSAWMYPETVVLLGAVILGGAGNMWGAALGALVLPVALLEATQFLPSFGPPELIPSVDWIVTGVLIILVIFVRPRGILPERATRPGVRRLLSAAQTDRTSSVEADEPAMVGEA